MKNHSNVIAALILGICIIISTLIYAYAHRYEIKENVVIDKYNATCRNITIIKK